MTEINWSTAVLIAIALAAALAGIIFGAMMLKEREEKAILALTSKSDLAGLGLSDPEPPVEEPSESRPKTMSERGARRDGGLVFKGFTDGAVTRIHLPKEAFDDAGWGICFGRDPSLVDQVLRDDHGHLSRRHFRISWSSAEERYEIEDLGSKAGVRVKGEPLTAFVRTPLPLPCRIEIGSATSLQVAIA